MTTALPPWRSKIVCARDVRRIQPAAPARIDVDRSQNPAAGDPADGVVHRIAEDGGGDQHDDHNSHVESSDRRDGARREQQRIPRQKRRHDETGFREDDEEQDEVDPCAIGGYECEQVPIDVEQDFEKPGRSGVLEGLREVLFQVFDVLDAGRDANEALRDPERLAFGLGTDACVIVAGWEIKVSTPPRLSASAISRTLFSSRPAASSDPSSNASIPPNPRICRAASACCGCDGRPG